jgi:hypothetical protein
LPEKLGALKIIRAFMADEEGSPALSYLPGLSDAGNVSGRASRLARKVLEPFNCKPRPLVRACYSSLLTLQPGPRVAQNATPRDRHFRLGSKIT